MPFSVSSSSLRAPKAWSQAAASKSVAAAAVPRRAQKQTCQIVTASNDDAIVHNSNNNTRQPASASVAALFASFVVATGSAVLVGPSAALGLESISIPALDNAVASTSSSSSSSSSSPAAAAATRPLSRQAAALADADAAFKSSELLRTLKERTAANAEANRKAITDKYCLRQSELGVGDCAGLRLIPGATKSGKQKTPKFLAKLIGKEEAIDEYNNNATNEAALAAVEQMRKNAAQ